MDKIRKEVEKLLEQERKYIAQARTDKMSIRGSDIDYGMGKIRAFERVLELLK